MKTLIKAILATALLVSIASADQPIVKIKVKNADPALIVLILSAKANTSTPPEMSTGFLGNFSGGFMGGGFGGGNSPGSFGGGSFGGGRN